MRAVWWYPVKLALWGGVGGVVVADVAAVLTNASRVSAAAAVANLLALTGVAVLSYSAGRSWHSQS